VCQVDGCDGKPVAKGLCAKHYMRARRQGSPDKVGKPGRPLSPLLEYYRTLKYGGTDRLIWDDASRRTLARYVRRNRLHHAGLSDQEIVDAIAAEREAQRAKDARMTDRERAQRAAALKEIADIIKAGRTAARMARRRT
jgi:hypothetical protein